MRIAKTQARGLVGGLSRPGKMPGSAYSLPAAECKAGSALRDVPGSTCATCYAYKRGRYAMHRVIDAQYVRLKMLKAPHWIEHMTAALDGEKWFRWHDSGDLQGLWHLENIAQVATNTPATMHWLPTRELGIVRQYHKKHGAFPANLRVRVSAAMVDGAPPDYPYTSTVHKNAPPIGKRCKLREKDDCGQCSACWGHTPNVSYEAH